MERGSIGKLEILADQIQEGRAEAIQLQGDSGVLLPGEGPIDETLGSMEHIGCRGSLYE